MSVRTPVIVGTGLSDYPIAPHLDAAGHHTWAIRRALEDCGLGLADIDGYLCTDDPMNPVIGSAAAMAEYLGLHPRYLDSTLTGGSVFEHFVQHASAAIEAGHCETVLISYGSDLLSRQGRTLGTGVPRPRDASVSGTAQYEAPYGNSTVGAYAMIAQRHMHEFGTTSEQLAEIAVAVRGHAQLNPNARYREAITIDDVVNSRLVADPLHLLDCCAITDGGGAIVLTTAERARDLPRPPVFVLGSSTAQTHWNISQMPDFTVTGAATCGPEAFAMAGVTPSDIDTVQIYDSFTITVLTILEDLGFAKKGEGGPFVAEGHLRLGRDLPLNTDGGGLSSCHPGMRGIFLLIEAARQLRGVAGAAQVPDCRVAAVVGSGGLLSSVGVVVLGKEPK
jgi:acetyl-CoA acetyltransferase